LSFSGKPRRFPGENDFSFRKDIFSRIEKGMNVNENQQKKNLTFFVQY